MLCFMDIEETVDRKTFHGYVMVQLQQKHSPHRRWQIIFDEGGIERHQGFAATEAEARAAIEDLIEKKKRRTTPRWGR